MFPFGFGLSYTQFEYGRLKLTTNGRSDGEIGVTFTVRNTGKAEGVETTQVYLRLPDATAEPGQRLVSFSQVKLKPGETRQVTATFDPPWANEPLSYWDVNSHDWAVSPGAYGVTVGGSSETVLTETFNIR